MDSPLNLSDHLPILLSCSKSLLFSVLSQYKYSLNSSPASSSIPPYSSSPNSKLSFCWDRNYTSLYYEATRDNLSNLHQLLNSCSIDSLKNSRPDLFTVKGLDTIYKNLVHSLLNTSLASVPLRDNAFMKSRKMWWSSDLSDLKARAINSFNTWRSQNSPVGSDSHACYIKCRAEFRAATRKRKKMFSNRLSENLTSTLITSNQNKFWKIWGSHFQNRKSSNPTTVDGCSDPQTIADIFATHFSETCSPNNEESNDVSKKSLNSLLLNLKSFAKPLIDIEMVDEAVKKIELKTASGIDNICIEHIKYAHPSLLSILSKLFNLFIETGSVPSDLCTGITTPIPKFKGNKINTDSKDYRGITINPIISKIFEHCLLKFLSTLETSDRQFGFKKGLGCVDAIHLFKKNYKLFHKKG